MALHRIPPTPAFTLQPGLYAFDGSGGITPSYYGPSDIFSMNGVTVPTHPEYSALGPSLTGAFLDPTLYGDMTMHAMRTNMDVANTLMYNQMSNYGIFNDTISGYDY